MKKKKSLFLKIVSFSMMFCMSFLFVGCMGMSPSELQGFEQSYDPNRPSTLDFDMFGTKVLYRPSDYNYNTGSGGTEDDPNDYYGKYAWNILENLYKLYGVVDNSTIEQRLPDNTLTNEEKAFFYDSIRYTIDTKGNITKIINNSDGEVFGVGAGETKEADEGSSFAAVIGANTDQKWEWSFSCANENVPALLYDAASLSNHHNYHSFDDIDIMSETIVQYYNDVGFQYQSIYLNTNDAKDYNNYSGYVKALEYAIYCYALDINPTKINVDYTQGDTPYVVYVGETPIDSALATIKETFNKAGSYVGLTEKQVAKIEKWVLDNIIGEEVYKYDSFKIYEDVVLTVGEDGTQTFEFTGTPEVVSFRNYETAVANIIDGVCELVSIGTEDKDGSGNIDDSFLASEIMEYAGNSFMIADDSNFPVEQTGLLSQYCIKPREYQSAVLMLKEQTVIDGIYIALKYDADADGTEIGVYNEEKYLDIIVELNYFSVDDDKMYTIGSKKARVYDGPFDISDNSLGMYDDFGNVYFYGFGNYCKEEKFLKHLDNDGCLRVGEFEVGIGEGCLMTDVGKIGGYVGVPIITSSENVIRLVGTNPARRFYELVEPTEEEAASLDGKTYVTGRLNHTKFSASKGGCDYLEITYKVLKDNKSDTSKNYNFYTGISFIY